MRRCASYRTCAARDWDRDGDESQLHDVPPLSFLITFAITVWLGRKIASRLVLHGVLIGIAGSIMYIVLTRGQPEPWPYLLAHVLKVAGGAAGGMVLARRSASTKLALESH